MKALQGSDLILFFRRYADREKESAAKLYFQTEHSIEKSKDNETTQTKDGTINTPGSVETTVPISSVAYANDDNTLEQWELLEDWFDNGERVEVWEANKAKKNEGGKFRGVYMQGTLTDFTKSAPTDGVVELEFTFAVDQKGQKGYMALDDEQQEVAQYVFTDLEPTTPGV